MLESEKATSFSEIKKNYKKLVKIHHPDKNPNSAEKFFAIQKAFDFLLKEYESSPQHFFNKI